MPPPNTLTVKLSTVTPLFLGGAEPNERAELRPPSLKGLLRYWYRALDATYRENEPRYFGSHDGATGQSPCLLRISNWQEGTEEWAQERHRERYTRGTGTHSTNGLIYLGYTLRMKPNQRKAIPAGTRFELQIIPHPKSDSEELRHAWLGALWALVHIGGAGSRARRGLGSLRIDGWSGWKEECDYLPLPCRMSTPVDWRKATGIADARLLQRWFDAGKAHDRTALSEGRLFALVMDGYASWEDALADAGLRLQRYRQRDGERLKDAQQSAATDYMVVKSHLGQRTPLVTGPRRAGFGLPLTFRYGSLGGANTEFRGTLHDRMASPLFVRVFKLGDKFHAAYIGLPTPMLPTGERLREKDGQRGLDWHPEAHGVVRDFIDHLGNDVLRLDP